jgi:hypothetical protein
VHRQEWLKAAMHFPARESRIADEIRKARQLRALNPDVVRICSEVESCGERILTIGLTRTPSTFRSAAGEIEWRSSHEVKIVFGRLFPAIPLEPYIVVPPFHPNIGSDDGFVCLWEDFRPERSIIDAIVALRNVLTWQSFNPADVHLMQPEALAVADTIRCPEWPRLTLPDTEQAPRGVLTP